MDAVFYSRHRTAAGRTNGQAEGLRLLFVLFLSVQEKDMILSFAKGEGYVLFSLRRKAPKDSLRLPPQTPKLLLGSVYSRLPTDGAAHLCALSVIRRAESNCHWKARARRRKARAA